MNPYRHGAPFDVETLKIHGLGYTSFARGIIMEVLRGIGISNENAFFSSAQDFFEFGMHQSNANLILIHHEPGSVVDLTPVYHLRRIAEFEISQAPVILISSEVTKSMLALARNAGVDEVVSRPVSPIQLRAKMKQLMETPRAFISTAEYIGPCRRRTMNLNYTGLRRRLDDFDADIDRTLPEAPGADELAVSIDELREACGMLSDDRMGLMARVREVANRTMILAKESEDLPLERTSQAVKHYLDGVGSTNLVESHVLETGINALTQLAVLPKSYHGARHAVASLMTVAVRKKLAHYNNRRLGLDSETEDLLQRINTGMDPVTGEVQTNDIENTEDQVDSIELKA